MNPFKEQKREEARKALTAKGIAFESFNNDVHWKVGSINFYPTTGKWMDAVDSSIEGHGYKDLIKHLAPVPQGKIKQLSVDQMFDIAKKVSPPNLYAVCHALHQSIYKGEPCKSNSQHQSNR